MVERRGDVGTLREVPRPSRTAVAAIAGAAIAFLAAVLVLSGEDGLPDPDPVAVIPADARDPFAYDESRRADFERRAAAGHAHTLYAKSPSGVVESARRTASFRAEIERAAPAAGVTPDLLEAIVFLESAGRPGAVADPKLEGAVGLTQILAETGSNLLGMKVDTRASRRLTRRIARAERAGDENRSARLRARRRRVDERFDPRKALEATGRYLALTRGRFGREDFAVAAYHMGIGNLESRDPGLRRRAAQLRRAVLLREPDRARRGMAAPGGSRRRLLDLPLARLRRPGDHARLPRGRRRASKDGRPLHGEELGRGGAAPRGGHGGVRRPRRSRVCLPRRQDPVVPAGAARAGPAAGPADGRAGGSAWSASGGSTAGCVPRPTHSPPTRRGSPGAPAAARAR